MKRIILTLITGFSFFGLFGQTNKFKTVDVNAPMFTDFPMTLERRIKHKIDESEEGYYIVAEVVNILVDEKYLTEDGQPDVQKMGLITYEPVTHSYVALGDIVGKAFMDGKRLKK